jgi:flagellar hook-length control protein FliK
MQTTTLPIQPNGASLPAARSSASASPSPEASQFSAALSRELEQRQEAAPAPAPAPKSAGEARPAAKKEAVKDKAPADEAAKPADAKPADQAAGKADDSADKADSDKQGADAAEHPATAQVTDILALVASLNQSLRRTGPAPAVTDKAAGALAGTKGLDAAQLASLQAAARALGKDSGDAAAGKAFGTVDQLKHPAAGFGAALAAQASGKEIADPAAGQAVLAKFKLQPDTAQVAAPVRDALPALPEAAPSAQLLAQLQPAALQAAQAAAGVTAEHIPARVGSNGWDQQVGQKIVWMAADGEQSAELTLNPPDLGPLQVVLNVGNDGASIEFSSSQLEVRQALENALPRLREMMSESGIALGNATVNAGMPDQRQAQGDGQGSGNRAGQAPHPAGRANATEPAPRTATRISSLGDRGMVDIFA